MEFNVSSATLLKALMDVSKAIPAKSSLPILENFLFTLKGGKLEITASDQELTLQTTVEVENGKDDSIAVPARHVTDLLKALPDQPVAFKTSGDSAFEVIWNNGNSSLPYFPAEDYPAIKGVGAEATTVTFKADSLAEGIGSTVYATADDEMRPTMNGIFFDVKSGSATLVASDSHKLICYTAQDVTAAAEASFILHKKAANALKLLLDKEDGDVAAKFDASTVLFTFGSTTMTCRLVVGKYPKYRDVIPQNNSNILSIDRELLLNTVKRIAVCANKASNHIKFALSSGELEITAQDLGFAIAAYEKVACDYTGDKMEIGFKSSFLIEILANMNCETVVMKFADGKRAALIVPSPEESSSEKICGIIMPVMVS